MTKEPPDSLIDEVLDFWLGAPGSSELGSRREIWFASSPRFDEEIRLRFGAYHRSAAEGDFDGLMRSRMGSLALVILLDQFSRNIHRGRAEAYSNDTKARIVAQHAMDRQFDRGLLTVQRLFFYLPFEHAEDPETQERSVSLFIQLGDAESLSHAICHRDQIVRFGRFPDRNQALGRKSSKAEIEFLNHPFC